VPKAPFLVAVVDDDAAIRRALARLLRSAGFESRSFASAVDFVNSLPLTGLRCVVLELHMPGMDGIEVQARLAGMSPPVPVIFITGHEDPATVKHALAQRPLAIMVKPIDDSVLLDAIAKVA